LNILFTRLQNIGDTLNAIPALRTLRCALPGARITWLAKHAGGVEVIRKCPYIDDLLIVQNRSLKEKLRLLREFRRRRIGYFIISPQDLGRVPWAFLGGAQKIVGYPRVYNYGRWQKEKLPRLLDISVKHDTTLTEVENCMKLVHDVLDDIGVRLPGDYSLELEYSWYTDEDKAAADCILTENGIDGQQPFVVSSPFSKRPAKNWPVDRLAALFTRMQKEWHVPVVFLGGEAEKPAIEKLCRELPGNVVNTAGKTSLAQSAVIMERSAMFFGPDSGPAFLAAAVKTPAVVLYGPADFYRWRPPENPVPRIEVYHGVPCSPCRHQVCPKTPACMDMITLDEVWDACSRVTGDLNE
jgi:heptosyltransferase-1